MWSIGARPPSVAPVVGKGHLAALERVVALRPSHRQQHRLKIPRGAAAAVAPAGESASAACDATERLVRCSTGVRARVHALPAVCRLESSSCVDVFAALKRQKGDRHLRAGPSLDRAPRELSDVGVGVAAPAAAADARANEIPFAAETSAAHPHELASLACHQRGAARRIQQRCEVGRVADGGDRDGAVGRGAEGHAQHVDRGLHIRAKRRDSRREATHEVLRVPAPAVIDEIGLVLGKVGAAHLAVVCADREIVAAVEVVEHADRRRPIRQRGAMGHGEQPRLAAVRKGVRDAQGTHVVHIDREVRVDD